MNSSFLLISTGALMSVFQLRKSKNPVHSVFYLVQQFLHCSGLLVQLGLEYFVLLQLLVYVGALAILFQFVVMLQDIHFTEIQAHQRGTYPVAGIFFLCQLLATVQALYQTDSPFLFLIEQRSSGESIDSFSKKEIFHTSWNEQKDSFSPVANIGIAQYGVHPDQQILASLLLLVAMVGAVGLTQKRPVAAPDYDVFAQHSVDFEKRILQIPLQKKKQVSSFW